MQTRVTMSVQSRAEWMRTRVWKDSKQLQPQCLRRLQPTSDIGACVQRERGREHLGHTVRLAWIVPAAPNTRSLPSCAATQGQLLASHFGSSQGGAPTGGHDKSLYQAPDAMLYSSRSPILNPHPSTRSFSRRFTASDSGAIAHGKAW